MKKILVMCICFIVISLCIPLSFQVMYSAQETSERKSDEVALGAFNQEDIVVPVFREELNVQQELLLEKYIIGVVSAEMPASFEFEALKAQAIAARTYTHKVLATEPYILDTVQHQVFNDEEQLRKRWGKDFEQNYAKIKAAVEETENLVMMYEDTLIDPLFFAISNGKTENSEDYFSNSLPYLRAVDSEWDKSVDDFEAQVSISLADLQKIFADDDLTFKSFQILSRTLGGNVQEVAVGDHVYSGREFREKLELRSADFSFEESNDEIYITTFGYGHGVGMSQHGANELAKTGKTYDQILNHYYQNIKIIEKNTLH